MTVTSFIHGYMSMDEVREGVKLSKSTCTIFRWQTYTDNVPFVYPPSRRRWRAGAAELTDEEILLALMTPVLF